MTAAERPGPGWDRALRLATRGSALALAQSRLVVDGLRAAWPELPVELVTVVTEGDRRRDVPAAAIGGKGIFTAAVQQAVLDGRADLAVHSAKDLPAVQVPGLVLAAVPERDDPRDVLLGRHHLTGPTTWGQSQGGTGSSAAGRLPTGCAPTSSWCPSAATQLPPVPRQWTRSSWLPPAAPPQLPRRGSPAPRPHPGPRQGTGRRGPRGHTGALACSAPHPPSLPSPRAERSFSMPRRLLHAPGPARCCADQRRAAGDPGLPVRPRRRACVSASAVPLDTEGPAAPSPTASSTPAAPEARPGRGQPPLTVGPRSPHRPDRPVPGLRSSGPSALSAPGAEPLEVSRP
jgi:hypothetical protein